jgi:hypothetical protein
MIEKVGYDREFMTGLIKEENLQGKTHCEIAKIRAKEKNSSVSRRFQAI